MNIPGVHLTQIGNTEFLLEPLRSLSIGNRGGLIEGIVERLLRAGATRLYYDLSKQAIIDPVYYDWLNQLARIVATINVKMVCIHMQPTAAFALVQFECARPAFETALDISDWQDSAHK